MCVWKFSLTILKYWMKLNSEAVINFRPPYRVGLGTTLEYSTPPTALRVRIRIKVRITIRFGLGLGLGLGLGIRGGAYYC